MRRTQVGYIGGGPASVGRTACWRRRRFHSLRRKQQQKQHDELTIPPFPVLLLCWAGGATQFGIRFSLGRREGWAGDSVCRICFSYYYPAVILIHSKFNQFPEAESILPIMATGE